MSLRIIILFIYLLTFEIFASEFPVSEEITETINKIEQCERLSCAIQYFSSELVKQHLEYIYEFNGLKRERMMQIVEKRFLYYKFGSITRIAYIKKNRVVYDTSDPKLKIEFVFIYENGKPVIDLMVFDMTN